MVAGLKEAYKHSIDCHTVCCCLEAGVGAFEDRGIRWTDSCLYREVLIGMRVREPLFFFCCVSAYWVNHDVDVGRSRPVCIQETRMRKERRGGG